ncbi:ABC transporter ATP-binding protein [Hyphomicrobium sp. CS1BSMeth3]|uniref:dipeptide ABC transporter ATP-binding protein n=1 Tax=Hyphomicrobium sp. CS1BSMeth3 TaxID=1892844 RepID=UPI000930DA7A|nr:ABC transporter ATP-binding protein [Hyphomicrobium sp. CS1BSMeth3]
MTAAAIPNAPPEVPLLDVRDLTVEFSTRRGTVQAVKHVDVTVGKGETVAIVGESGSGKSVTSYAVMRILDRAGHIANGTITFGGVDVGKADERNMRDLRGREISMIFQNPRAALNPIRKVGHQIEDVLRQHAQAGSDDAKTKAIAILEQVRIARPDERYHAFPFELSGGMCQRVVIALALACRPQLLIADEPTTGLDVTTQKTVMDLVVELTRERGMSTILITHDLGLAAAYCDRVVVMEKGRVVETANSHAIFSAPNHPYTRKLVRATPRPGVTLTDLLPEDDAVSRSALRKASAINGAAHQGAGEPPLLVVDNLIKEYPRKDVNGGSFAGLFKRNGAASPDAPPPVFRAVDGISFSVRRGESVGLVGESGCGKSTTSTMVMRLIDKTDGQILFDGEDIGAIPARQFARLPLRKRIQMVFQDPTESLNPRFTAARAIADPILRMGDEKGTKAVRARCEELATQVGLPLDLLDRFPHQLSGGQKARIGIARAIALKPELVILDEPTAALDVSVQAVVLNLLQDLKEQLGMSYLFVSHDLNVVRLLCDRVIVMQAGRIVEEGPTEQVLGAPAAAYTRELLSAIPHPPL